MKEKHCVLRHSVRLLRNCAGNFGIMTALLAVPVALAAGLALDLSKAVNERVKMQAIADSAALAGGALFNGSNAAAAKKAADAFLAANLPNLPTGAKLEASFVGQTMTVSLSGDVPTDFMHLAGQTVANVGVTAQAYVPSTPSSIQFKPTNARGVYYKQVSIMVVRPKGVVEETVGTVTYQPITRNNGGQGTMVVSPSSTLELGEYSRLLLKMDIKNDGCPLRYRASVSNNQVTCNPSTRDADTRYNLTLRSDNPATSHYLFVDGVQLPQGVASPLESVLECGATIKHAWEDGGGFAQQDFFYQATSICSPNGQYVRLTK